MFQIKLFSFLVCIFLCMHVCITLCPVLQCCISPCVILRWRFGWKSQPPPKKPSFWVLRQEAGPKPNTRTIGRWGAQQIRRKTQDYYQEFSAGFVFETDWILLFTCVFFIVCSCWTGRIRSEQISGVFSPTGVMRNSLEELLLGSFMA